MEYFKNSPLSQNTIQLYTTRITKWIHLVPNHSIEYIIRFPRQSLILLLRHLIEREKIEKKEVCTHANIRNYLAAIAAVIRHSPHILPTLPDRTEYYLLWTKLIEQTNKLSTERRLQQLPTDKQLQRGGSKLTYNDLIEMRDHSDIDPIKKLLLAMYTYIYPVRADYYATQIIYNDDTPSSPNYIRIFKDHAELRLTEFKTSRIYKQIYHPVLPLPLFQLILQSLEQFPRSFLFVGADNNPHTRNSYSKWASDALRSLFGVELNLTMIRHLFITTISMELPASELKKIGDLMGHSLSTQRLYKWHLSDVDESSEDDDK